MIVHGERLMRPGACGVVDAFARSRTQAEDTPHPNERTANARS